MAPLRTTRNSQAAGLSGSALSRQLQKRILDHVFRYVTPLPREQFERGGVLVQEVAEQVRIHAISASPVVDCLSLWMTTADLSHPLFFLGAIILCA